MIDVIILSNSSKKDVIKTLNSVLYQFIETNYNIFVLDYNKKIDYTDIVDDYNKITKIKELKCDEDINIGSSKNYALKKSKGDFIIFINSGDIFTHPFALSILYDKAEKQNADMVYGDFFVKKDESYIFVEDDFNTLNSKLYRRSFIDTHLIKFNESKINISYEFNKQFELYGANICYVDNNFCVIKDNNYIALKNNLYEYDYISHYIDNILFLLDNVDNNKLTELLYCSLYLSYCYYLKNNKIVKKDKIIIIKKKYIDNRLSKKKENDIKIDCVSNLCLLELIVNSEISFNKFLDEVII